MQHTNLSIIDKFFDAFSRHDINDLQKVLSEDIKWIFPGKNPLSGTKQGIEGVISFFDRMGDIMGKSDLEVERLVMGVNDDYVSECQHIITNRECGINIDQYMCVLWKFKDGKIIEGKHFTTGQYELDSFFSEAFQ